MDIHLIVVCNYPDLLQKISELYPYHKRSSQQTYYVSIGMYVNKKGNQITHIPAYYQTECAEKKLLFTHKKKLFLCPALLFYFRNLVLFTIFILRKIVLISPYHSNFANYLFMVGYTEKMFMQRQ